MSDFEKKKIQIVYSARFRKNLHKIDRRLVLKIISKIEYMCCDDYFKYSKSLQGRFQGVNRFRIGSYRVFFYVENCVFTILDINHRKDAYKK